MSMQLEEYQMSGFTKAVVVLALGVWITGGVVACSMKLSDRYPNVYKIPYYEECSCDDRIQPS